MTSGGLDLGLSEQLPSQLTKYAFSSSASTPHLHIAEPSLLNWLGSQLFERGDLRTS
jgi:hypothetical protein